MRLTDETNQIFQFETGEFHVTFLYNSVASSTPWELIIANNFGQLIPLFLEIYELLKQPIFNSSSATIGNISVFHHQNAIGYHTADNSREYLQSHRTVNSIVSLSNLSNHPICYLSSPIPGISQCSRQRHGHQRRDERERNA